MTPTHFVARTRVDVNRLSLHPLRYAISGGSPDPGAHGTHATASTPASTRPTQQPA